MQSARPVPHAVSYLLHTITVITQYITRQPLFSQSGLLNNDNSTDCLELYIIRSSQRHSWLICIDCIQLHSAHAIDLPVIQFDVVGLITNSCSCNLSHCMSACKLCSHCSSSCFDDCSSLFCPAIF